MPIPIIAYFAGAAVVSLVSSLVHNRIRKKEKKRREELEEELDSFKGDMKEVLRRHVVHEEDLREQNKRLSNPNRPRVPTEEEIEFGIAIENPPSEYVAEAHRYVKDNNDTGEEDEKITDRSEIIDI